MECRVCSYSVLMSGSLAVAGPGGSGQRRLVGGRPSLSGMAAGYGDGRCLQVAVSRRAFEHGLGVLPGPVWLEKKCESAHRAGLFVCIVGMKSKWDATTPAPWGFQLHLHLVPNRGPGAFLFPPTPAVCTAVCLDGLQLRSVEHPPIRALIAPSPTHPVTSGEPGTACLTPSHLREGRRAGALAWGVGEGHCTAHEQVLQARAWCLWLASTDWGGPRPVLAGTMHAPTSFEVEEKLQAGQRCLEELQSVDQEQPDMPPNGAAHSAATKHIHEFFAGREQLAGRRRLGKLLAVCEDLMYVLGELPVLPYAIPIWHAAAAPSAHAAARVYCHPVLLAVPLSSPLVRAGSPQPSHCWASPFEPTGKLITRPKWQGCPVSRDRTRSRDAPAGHGCAQSRAARLACARSEPLPACALIGATCCADPVPRGP